MQLNRQAFVRAEQFFGDAIDGSMSLVFTESHLVFFGIVVGYGQDVAAPGIALRRDGSVVNYQNRMHRAMAGRAGIASLGLVITRRKIS